MKANCTIRSRYHANLIRYIYLCLRGFFFWGGRNPEWCQIVFEAYCSSLSLSLSPCQNCSANWKYFISSRHTNIIDSRQDLWELKGNSSCRWLEADFFLWKEEMSVGSSITHKAVYIKDIENSGEQKELCPRCLPLPLLWCDLSSTTDAVKNLGQIKSFIAWASYGVEDRTWGLSDCIYPLPRNPRLLISYCADHLCLLCIPQAVKASGAGHWDFVPAWFELESNFDRSLKSSLPCLSCKVHWRVCMCCVWLGDISLWFIALLLLMGCVCFHTNWFIWTQWFVLQKLFA